MVPEPAHQVEELLGGEEGTGRAEDAPRVTRAAGHEAVERFGGVTVALDQDGRIVRPGRSEYRGEVRPADTTEDAWQVRMAALSALSPSERFEQAVELCLLVGQLAEAGVRARHPSYGDEEVRMAVHRLRLGDELTRAAWPGVPLVEP